MDPLLGGIVGHPTAPTPDPYPPFGGYGSSAFRVSLGNPGEFRGSERALGEPQGRICMRNSEAL